MQLVEINFEGLFQFLPFCYRQILANYFRAAMRGKAAKKLFFLDFEGYKVAVQWLHTGDVAVTVVVLPSKTVYAFKVGLSGGT